MKETIDVKDIPELKLDSSSIFSRFVVDYKTIDKMTGDDNIVRAFNGCIFTENNIVLVNPKSNILLQYRSLEDFAFEIRPEMGYMITYLDKDIHLHFNNKK